MPAATLDQKTLTFMQNPGALLAWPTIALTVALPGACWTVGILEATGSMALWLTILVSAAFACCACTRLHEASHGHAGHGPQGGLQQHPGSPPCSVQCRQTIACLVDPFSCDHTAARCRSSICSIAAHSPPDMQPISAPIEQDHRLKRGNRRRSETCPHNRT
jgi:hypothetical protein